jgi:hypothetical protein
MNSQLKTFNAAIDKILRADPVKVKADMEQDKRNREEARKAKKLPSASARASNGKD